MILEFEGPVFTWRGPAPYYYVRLPDDEAESVRDVAAMVTYGWGVIPVTAEIGETTWTTSLFPKDGSYLVPLKDVVRRAESVDDGDVVSLRLTLDT